MKKNVSLILICSLLLSMANLWRFPTVSATPLHKIILPFHTSWENPDPLGATNSLESIKDFYGYSGPNDPSPPELGWRNNEVVPPSDVFGYNFGGRQLLAAGYFGSSYSFCYFNLFDQTQDSDWGPPFMIKEHTFINIWYYHYQLADCMIDAQLYNQRTGQMWTLRDFCYDGKYIVDQNGTRLHPACRSNDPIGSWEFACFDLSTIWESDPDNWCVTKIWIAFDNGNDGVTGQARTYFDILYISYGVRNAQSHTQNGDNALASGSVVAWHYTLRPDGYYDLWLKVTCLGFDNGTWPDFFGYPIPVTPQLLRVSSINYSSAQVLANPKPTGVNLYNTNSSEPPSAVQKLVYDGFMAVGDVYAGGLCTIFELAQDVWGLIYPPPPEPYYEWPPVNSSLFTGSAKTAVGEVTVLIPGLAAGTVSINVTLSVDIGYWVMGYYYPQRIIVETFLLPIVIAWSTLPDPQSDSPNDPERPSGRTCGYAGAEYSYSTRTSDPNGDDVLYFFDWNDGSTGVTGLYASGAYASLSHVWNCFGSRSIRVQALDRYGLWSGWSSSLNVDIYGMGDCDSSHDGEVNILDAAAIGIHFGSAVPPAPIDVDITPNNVIDIFDIVRVALVFGDSYSYPQGFGAPPDSRESDLLDGQTASVSLIPGAISVTKHQTFTVNVTLTDVADLYGWEFQLYWNNTVLNLTSAQVITPECWGEDTFELGSGIENGFNATHGRFWKAMSALNPAPSINESLTLATLTFEALNTGTTQLHLEGVALASAEASPSDHEDIDGTVTVTPKTLYMRSDQHTINNATMYKLMETHTQVGKSTNMSTTDPEDEVACYWGVRVWKRSANGTEVELTSGSPVAIVSRSTSGQGLQSATWNCPSTSLNPADSLIVRVYYKFDFQSYSLSSQFTTVQLNATSLEGQTWTIFYYTSRTHNSQQHKTYMYYKWDNTYLSKIENLDYD